MNQPTQPAPALDAIHAWETGLDSVCARRLVSDSLRVEDSKLLIDDLSFDLNELSRIRVVGAGKAAGAMLLGLEDSLGTGWMREKQVEGWINIPHPKEPVDAAPFETQKKKETQKQVRRFRARPAGENLPTEDCCAGTQQIEKIVSRTASDELCIMLLSGGGSALLAHPADGIWLQDMRKLIAWMSGAKASIRQMNVVRQQISRVKGGRLATQFNGGHMATLILSDVLGDLELVASGPTMPCSTGPVEALEVLKELDPKLGLVPASILKHLRRKGSKQIHIPDNVSNHLIGDIRIATAACQSKLEELGYEVSSEIQTDEFETANQAGVRMARWLNDRVSTGKPLALVSGGEPVVELCKNPGQGGRNLQLVLAAIVEMMDSDVVGRVNFALLSGGSDGEDGTTSVAGASVCNQDLQLYKQTPAKPVTFLSRNDAFTFFKNHSATSVSCSPFLRSPKDLETNVCDLRVVLVVPK